MTMMEQSDLKAALGTSGNRSATVCVYGYGPAKNPFYKEAKTLKMHSGGCSLILSAPVSGGQKLLLIGGRENPVEGQIVNTRTLAAQIFEVEVTFAVPHPDFWQPLQKQ
jgi:hypothetical protein